MTTPTVSLHFTVQQGATFRQTFKRFQVPSEAVARNGVLVYKATGRAVPEADKVPVDYSGCTARMQVRRDIGHADVLLTFSTEPQAEQGRITLGADGAVELYLSHAQTSAIAWSDAVGQMEVTFANGDVERHFEIALCVDPEGTRGD
ncbi:hypothetical protein [Comamonas aquatica]|uniref:hypothetical protein n=1 Tax=Comamonas aquatica TaxID=225991 RepID=UPI0034D4E681